MEFGGPRYKSFGLDMYPNFEEVGFKAGPSFWGGLKCSLSTAVGNGGFKPCKTVVLDQGWKHKILLNKRGIDLETKFPKVGHAMAKVLLAWLTRLRLKLVFWNCVATR